MKIVKSDEAGLDAAAAVLLAGGVAVIPTDTVYGLAAHPKFPDAVARLYTIKGRAAGKPIAMLAADAGATGILEKQVKVRDEGEQWRDKPSSAQPSTSNLNLLLSRWPGALTVVYGGEGYRVPDHDWTRRLLAKCGGLLRVTSANMSGQRAATDAEAALADVGLSADLVVDDGVSKGGVASTVVKIEDDGSVTVLREGPVKV